MIRHRKFVVAGIVGTLLIGLVVGGLRAQLLTAPAPVKVDDTVHIQVDLQNSEEEAFAIPADRALIVTDVVATCLTINACALHIFGPTHNASDDLVTFLVPATTTVSHAFNTGMRVEGANGGQLFIQNFIQPGPNALLHVTITGYLVKS
jgi:hypothetical protein